MLTWLGNWLTQGNVAPLAHLNIYRTKSTLIICTCRARLPRWVSSSFVSTSVMLMNTKDQDISSAGAFASCPPVWGIWQDFKPAEQLQPPQATQKKQLEKSCDFSTVFFWTDYCRLAATSKSLSSENLGILTLL